MTLPRQLTWAILLDWEWVPQWPRTAAPSPGMSALICGAGSVLLPTPAAASELGLLFTWQAVSGASHPTAFYLPSFSNGNKFFWFIFLRVLNVSMAIASSQAKAWSIAVVTPSF